MLKNKTQNETQMNLEYDFSTVSGGNIFMTDKRS